MHDWPIIFSEPNSLSQLQFRRFLAKALMDFLFAVNRDHRKRSRRCMEALAYLWCGNGPVDCDNLERNGMAVAFKQVPTALLQNRWLQQTHQNLLLMHGRFLALPQLHRYAYCARSWCLVSSHRYSEFEEKVYSRHLFLYLSMPRQYVHTHYC